MNEAMDPPRAVIGTSNLSLPPLHLPFMPATAYQGFLEKAGFDAEAGVEWTAVRFPRAQVAAEQLAASGLVKVVHESWREVHLREALVPPNIQKLKVVAGFPLLDESYDSLNRLQKASMATVNGLHARYDQVGLPVIVHPKNQWLDNQPPRRPRQQYPFGMFQEIWFQPTAEWAKAWGAHPGDTNVAAVARRITEVQAEQGFDGMVLDLHHLQMERGGHRFADVPALVHHLAQATSFREVQVSFRPDFGGDPAEVEYACRGQLARTALKPLLEAVNDAVPASDTIRVVTEAQASIIGKYGLEGRTLAESHKIINESIRTFFATKTRPLILC